MNTILRLALPLALLAAPAAAQSGASGTTPQTLAQQMFAEANAAIGNADYEAARRLLEAALDLKPAHPAILRGLAIVALRAENPEDGFQALERMARAGIAFDPEPLEVLLRTANTARFEAVAGQLAANSAPVGQAEVVAEIDRPGALIEGVAIDIETDRLFVSSVTGREILLLEPFARDEPRVFADREDGLWSVFGLAVDDRTRVVWAGSAAIAVFAAFHGNAHGLEAGHLHNAGLYALGFAVSTAALHAIGIGAGLATRSARMETALRAGGAGIALAGATLFFA